MQFLDIHLFSSLKNKRQGWLAGECQALAIAGDTIGSHAVDLKEGTVSWTLADFKSTSLEVGQWCWGTMEGAFNEKQTISQVIVDAVIGMIPLLGDATACRDLLAVSIGMCTDPRKRVDRMQWLLLVILLFALIPVVGGVIKGVGRLLMRVTGDAAKDTALLAEIVQFLNRVGHGNAPDWIKSLNVLQYQAQLIDKCHAFVDTIHATIQKTLNARVGKALPEKWREKIKEVGEQLRAVRDMAGKMVPQALQDLNVKLIGVQRLIYKGELHELATGGMPKVKREAEAYLEERRIAIAERIGKYGPTKCNASKGVISDSIKAEYQPKINEGWPDLLRMVDKTHPQFPKTAVYGTVASFHGVIKPVEKEHLAGKTLYRAFGNKSGFAGESQAGGAFWGIGQIPTGAENWRVNSAVLDEWNSNGFIAVMHLPANVEAIPAMKGWLGQIAEQYGRKIPGQYLGGGGEQLFIDFGKEFKAAVDNAGNIIKGGGTPSSVEMFGVKVEFHKTGWEHVSHVYGYDISREINAARTRRLAEHVVEEKDSQPAVVN